MKTFTLTEAELRNMISAAWKEGFTYYDTDPSEPLPNNTESYVDIVIAELSNEKEAKTFLPVTEFMITRGCAIFAMEYENHPEKRFEAFEKFCKEHKDTMVQTVYADITRLINVAEHCNELNAVEAEDLRCIMRGY